MKNNEESCAARHSEQSLQSLSVRANLVTSYNFFSVLFVHHLHSTQRVQVRISKSRNLLPNLPNLKFGVIAHHN